MRSRHVCTLFSAGWRGVVTFVLLLLAASPASGQFPPDSLYNIQVLPEAIETRELIGVMRGFALGLGVRCEFCHVGEAGQPLAEFDFPSDEKPMKEKARHMLQMVMDINETFLADLPERREPHIAVQCVTCHRGQARPVMLEDLLQQTLAEQGLDSAKAEYRRLRERFYGSHTYDFTERTLNLLAQSLFEQQAIDHALGMLELNEEFYPQSAGIQYMMGEALAAKGERDAAIARLERALELNPNFPPAQRRLADLKAK